MKRRTYTNFNIPLIDIDEAAKNKYINTVYKTKFFNIISIKNKCVKFFSCGFLTHNSYKNKNTMVYFGTADYHFSKAIYRDYDEWIEDEDPVFSKACYIVSIFTSVLRLIGSLFIYTCKNIWRRKIKHLVSDSTYY